MAMVQCPHCEQWIERRGFSKHYGSKKCQVAAAKLGKDKPVEKEDTETVCPECGSDLKLLTSSTKIVRDNGAYVPQDQIQAALDQGDTMYCDRCLMTYH